MQRGHIRTRKARNAPTASGPGRFETWWARRSELAAPPPVQPNQRRQEKRQLGAEAAGWKSFKDHPRRASAVGIRFPHYVPERRKAAVVIDPSVAIVVDAVLALRTFGSPRGINAARVGWLSQRSPAPIDISVSVVVEPVVAEAFAALAGGGPMDDCASPLQCRDIHQDRWVTAQWVVEKPYLIAVIIASTDAGVGGQRLDLADLVVAQVKRRQP